MGSFIYYLELYMYTVPVHYSIPQSEFKLSVYFFSSFIDKISEHCLNLTDLVIEFTTDKSESRTWRNPLPLAWIKWIPNLRNCEKLTLNTHIAPKYGNFEPFFQNPMMHLKEVNLGACGAFLRDLFLINLFEAFPNLQKLNINLPKANATIKWKIENLTLVLKTLAKVKNLKISNLEVYLERGNDESRDEILRFLTEALEITQQKFSEDISDFKIQEDHYGFIMSKEKLNFVKLNNCLKIDGHTGRTVNDVFLRMLPQQDLYTVDGQCCNKQDHQSKFLRGKTGTVTATQIACNHCLIFCKIQAKP